MKARDLQRLKMSRENILNNCGKSSTHAMKEKGSTEIISKYNNYHITEIVTDLTRNEVTEIGKITRETLEDIIGGYVCMKRKKISEENSIIVKSEPLQETDDCSDETLYDTGDSSKFQCNIEMPSTYKSTELSNTTGDFTGKCYVKLEFNEIIEDLQNKFKENSKVQERELVLVNPAGKIVCASHKQACEPMKTEKVCTKECYVRMEIDSAIENMQNKMKQISETQIENANKNILKILDAQCDHDEEPQKTFTENNTEELTSNPDNKSRKRKKFKECYKHQNIDSLNNPIQRCEYANPNMENKNKLPDQIFNSFFPSKGAIRKVLNDICHYERENNILIYENLRIENSLIKAISRIKFLERELNNLERNNNYTFLRKYFEENEVTALIENSKIDWNNEMITKALQLRFACGNEGYKEILRNINLPSLKTLRNRVYDSQFDLALLAKDMIHF